MENILLYLGLLIGGYLAGLLVNLIADWLYLRRRFFEASFTEELAEKGWTRYLTNPFSFVHGEQRFKVRSIVVDLVFIALVFSLGANGRQIAAGTGFSHRHCKNMLARNAFR